MVTKNKQPLNPSQSRYVSGGEKQTDNNNGNFLSNLFSGNNTEDTKIKPKSTGLQKSQSRYSGKQQTSESKSADQGEGEGFFSNAWNKYKSLYKTLAGPASKIINRLNPTMNVPEIDTNDDWKMFDFSVDAPKDMKELESRAIKSTVGDRLFDSTQKRNDFLKGVGKEFLEEAEKVEKNLYMPITKTLTGGAPEKTGVTRTEELLNLEENSLTKPSNPTQAAGKLGTEIGSYFLPTGGAGKLGRKLLMKSAPFARKVGSKLATRFAAKEGGSALSRSASKRIPRFVEETIQGGARVAPEATSDALITAIQTEGDLDQVGLAAAFPFAFGSTIRGAGLGTGLVADSLKPKVRSGISKLEDIATRTGTELDNLGKDDVLKTITDDIKFKPTTKQKAARVALRGVDKMRGFHQNWVDRFSSLKKIDERYEEATGTKLDDSQRVHVRASLTEPITRQRVKQTTADVENVRDRLNEVSPNLSDIASGYLVKLDELNRAKSGKTVAKGRSKEELQDIVRKTKESLSPEEFAAVENARKFIKTKNVQLLAEAVDSGLITQKTMTNLLKKNPDYIPHQVVLETIEKAYDNVAAKGRTFGTINSSKKIIQEAKGSERALNDPFQAVTDRFAAMQDAIEKNNTVKRIVQRAETNPEVFSDFRKVKGNKIDISEPRRKELGVGTINVFRDGVKETWLVPRDIEVAIKNLNSEQMNKMMRVITAPSRIMRSAATGKNPSFFLPNIARDVQTGLLTADQGLAVDAFMRAAFKQNPELLAEAANQGSFFGASVYKIDDPFVKNSVSELEGSGLMKTVKKGATLDMIEDVAENLENATRYAAYVKAVRNGASKVEAANIARNVTVDFNRMGQMMRPLNQLIPFLNARLQGTINIAKAAGRNPERFARMQYLTGIMPTMELYNHNRNFETYKNIPKYITDNYWVFMVDEIEGVDEDGNEVTYPQYISIPKGEGQKLVSNPTEFILKRSDNIDRRATSEMLTDTALSITPITFQSLRTEDLAAGLAASFGPIPRMVVGEFSNKDPFTGMPIIPMSREDASPEMQFTDRTPEITKKVAQAVGVSPAKMQFNLESLFAGIGRDVPQLIDKLSADEPDKGFTDTEFGQLTRTPVARSFVRESGDYYNPENVKMRNLIQDVKQKTTDKSIQQTEIERHVKERLLDFEPHQRVPELKAMVKNDVIDKKTAKDILSGIRESLTPTEKQLRNMGVNNFGRSITIYQYLQTLPKENEKEYLNTLKDKKILTEKVYNQLRLLDRNAGLVPRELEEQQRRGIPEEYLTQ